jgi:Integrase core domain
VLPAPRVPDGLTITPDLLREPADIKAPTDHIPDNGIAERFHKTVLDEFYRVAFRKKIYGSIAELQSDLDQWIAGYNEERPHQGRWCFGKTPMQTFLDAKPLAKEKLIAA